MSLPTRGRRIAAGLVCTLTAATLLAACTWTRGTPPSDARPSASASPSAPSGGSSASATSSGSPTGDASGGTSGGAAGPGCPAGGGPIPAASMTATIADVDGDGRPDTEFYTQTPPFEYGIHTASGATIALPDRLAGPNAHSGWTSVRENAVVTVVDDGRTAKLHAFLDCSFVTTTDANGTPYTFALNGFGDYGTGVECTNENGGALLAGVLAARQPDGSYTITGTVIALLDRGRVAQNGATFPIGSGLAQNDPQVRLAMRSTCGSTPIVHTDGR